MIKSDILIIGSGIAGLSTAIKIAGQRPELSIKIFSKTEEVESNTNYAQGGIAAVWDHLKDSYESHIEDTMTAGDGLGKRSVVEMVVKEGPERIREIIDWGVRFDQVNSKEYDLAKEGGHSTSRILHFGDLTGRELQRALMQKAEAYPNIEILEYHFAIDLVTQHHIGYHITRVTPNIECYGIYALNRITGSIDLYLSKVTVLASGGAGQVYKTTTNPAVSTGDGMAMVYRAKGRLTNMEFVQFHPTALYDLGENNPSFLISEAVRGYGGELKTIDGETFMHKYDERGSLAPRDIVARAIDAEVKKRGDEHVMLDCTHLDKAGFISHFPNIYKECKARGIDPMNDYIPVQPACHYICGGVDTDQKGHSTIQSLYAVGECAFTGLHGANRLASNSLLEAVVMAHKASENILQHISEKEIQRGVPEWNAKGTDHPNEMVLITQSRKELKEIMSNYVGIVRSPQRLKRAIDRLHLLYLETEALYQSSIISPQLCELRNLITVGYLITRSASLRKESRGLHFNIDFPEKLPKTHNTYL